MKLFVLSFLTLAITDILHAQITAEKNCTRYEMSCSMSTFVRVTVQEVINKADTSYSIGFAENRYLNDFLAQHAKKHNAATDTGSIDVRIVYVFIDKSGKEHKLGFDCFGNYMLDSNSYLRTDELAIYEKKLKVGVYLDH